MGWGFENSNESNITDILTDDMLKDYSIKDLVDILELEFVWKGWEWTWKYLLEKSIVSEIDNRAWEILERIWIDFDDDPLKIINFIRYLQSWPDWDEVKETLASVTIPWEEKKIFILELMEAHSVFLQEIAEARLESLDELGPLESTIPYKQELQNFNQNLAA